MTDQGTEFTNKLLERLLKRLDIDHKMTPPYYPQANGQVERFNRTLIESLAKQCEDEPSQWERFIDGTLFAYRVSKIDGLGMSPFQIVYARDPVLPMQIIDSNDIELHEDVSKYGTRLTFNLQKAHEALRKLLKKQADERNRVWNAGAKPLQLKVGDKVLLLDTRGKNRKTIESVPHLEGEAPPSSTSAKLNSTWTGPYTVTKVLNNAIEIDDTDRKEKRTVALANVKRFIERSETTSTEPLPESAEEAPDTVMMDVDTPSKATAKDNSCNPCPSTTSTSDKSPKDVEPNQSEVELRRSTRKRQSPAYRKDYALSTDEPQPQSTSSNALDLRQRMTPYCIERIVGHERQGNCMLYEVKWEGYPSSQNTWLRENHFDDKETLNQYWSSQNSTDARRDAPKRYQPKPQHAQSNVERGEGSRQRKRVRQRR
jgi:hypothetical protein